MYCIDSSKIHSLMGNFSCIRLKPEIHHATLYSVNSRTNNSSKDGLGCLSTSCSSSQVLSSSTVPPTPQSEGEVLNSKKLKSFTFVKARSATGNFRPDNVLGDGGFGSVFMGWIDENTLVATKLRTEIVIAVKRLKHEGFRDTRSSCTMHGGGRVRIPLVRKRKRQDVQTLPKGKQSW